MYHCLHIQTPFVQPLIDRLLDIGIFIYEMLASYPPFYDEDPMKTYSKIMAGTIHYPSHFSTDAVSLISKLLQARVSKRLGMLQGGIQDIKQHVWFKRINWDDIYAKRTKAPIIPKIRSDLDTSNFDNTYAGDSQKILPYMDDGSQWDAEF
jgi:serine/threonine protein kinase